MPSLIQVLTAVTPAKDYNLLRRGTLQSQILEAAWWEREGHIPTQQELSSLIDAATRRSILDAHSADPLWCSHVELCSVPGAGAWGPALPVPDGRQIETPLFQVALKRRLREPVLDDDVCCPCCGSAMDKWGDHGLVCSCHGDRTVRHNGVRNMVYEDAAIAGLRPRREKPGLLPGRPAQLMMA